MLPKGDKPREYLKNARPVTLLNCDYKINSGVIADRINGVLAKLINTQQCGFVPGRFLGENIRNTYDTFEIARQKRITGLLLLIDFEKAFDSLSFKFIIQTLRFFGFKDTLISWVETLLYNFKACINMAGNLSPFLNIARGARQGDPVASALFVLALEILCIKLRQSRNVTPLRIENVDAELSLFADDMSIFLNYDEQNLRNTIEIMSSYYTLSGLKLQVEKTQAVVFGFIPDGDPRLCPDINLNWNPKFRLLGIDFSADLLEMKNNLKTKINEIDAIINNWRYRFLTPIGRSVVVKTLLLSKLSHIAMVIPSMNKTLIKSLEDKIYNFIWAGPDKVARIDAKKPKEIGGLDLPDIYSRWQSFKISWFRRLYSTNSLWGKIFDICLNQAMPGCTREMFFTKIGTFDLLYLSKNINLSFWREAIYALKDIMPLYVKVNPQKLIVSNIWNSSFFLKNRTPCKERSFRQLFGKVQYPIELMEFVNGRWEFLPYNQIVARFGHIPENDYISLKVVIQQSFQKLGTYPKEEVKRPFQPIIVQIANISVKGCNRWAALLKNKNNCNKTLLERERKWEHRLGRMQGNFFWDKCYKNVKNIFFDNKLKIFYYHIVRGTLKTNIITYHFVQGTSRSCSFCSRSEESIPHLFFDCPVVSVFLDMALLTMPENLDIFHNIFDKKEFIFGIRDEHIYSPFNLFILYLKRFIWICRCRESKLNSNGFFKWFQFEIKMLKDCFYEDKRLPFLHNF